MFPRHFERSPIFSAPTIQAILEAGYGTYADLHPLFQPPGIREVTPTPELIWEASRLAPYDRLPRSLVNTITWYPKLTPGNWTPPIFHYGWRPNIQKLLDFAQARGLTVTYGDDEPTRSYTYPNILRPRPSCDEYLYDFPVTDGGYTVKMPKPETVAFWPPVEEITRVEETDVFVFPTISEALDVMLREAVNAGTLGPWCHSVSIALTLRADEGTNYVVSVLDNVHQLAGREAYAGPTLEDMAQLAAVIGVSGSPRWYVDRDDLEWEDSFASVYSEYDQEEDEEDDSEEDGGEEEMDGGD